MPCHPRRPGRTLLGVLLLAALSAGCSLDVGQACTAEYVYGLTVEVRDSATGNPAGGGATVLATSGSFIEQLKPFSATLPITDTLTFLGAGERKGLYVVSVEKTGYRTWQSDPLVVGWNGCHVVPVFVDVRLRPLPSE